MSRDIRPRTDADNPPKRSLGRRKSQQPIFLAQLHHRPTASHSAFGLEVGLLVGAVLGRPVISEWSTGAVGLCAAFRSPPL